MVTSCRSLCSLDTKSKQLSCCRAFNELQSKGCHVSHLVRLLLIRSNNLHDLPSMQIKMKFPLTSECRSQKEAKVFMFVFSFGYSFGFPLLPVLI